MSESGCCRGEKGAVAMNGQWKSVGDVMALGIHSQCQALTYPEEINLLNHMTELDRIILIKKRYLHRFFYLLFNIGYAK